MTWSVVRATPSVRMRSIVFAPPRLVAQEVIGCVDSRHPLGELGRALRVAGSLVRMQLARQLSPATLDGRVAGAGIDVEDAIRVTTEGRLRHDTRGYHPVAPTGDKMEQNRRRDDSDCRRGGTLVAPARWH